MTIFFLNCFYNIIAIKIEGYLIMEKMSPILQATIEQQQQNNAQNTYTQQSKVDMAPKPDVVDLSTNNKPKKNKAFKVIAIITGLLATVAGGFALAKKGYLGEKLQKSANNLWTNITKLFKKSAVKGENPEPPTVPEYSINDFDKDYNVTRHKNGIGQKTIRDQVGLGEGKCIEHWFYEPNSYASRTNIDIFDDNLEKQITIMRPTPTGFRTTSKVAMKKDAKGNVIEVITNMYNGSKDKGGKQIVTEIVRDEAGKVIDHTRTVYEDPSKWQKIFGEK